MKAKAIDIGMTPSDRKRIAGELGVILADTYTLYLTTHGYHWNVTGPMFPSLHALFEQQYNELWLAVDRIAERIRGLGQPAPFGCGAFSRQATLGEGKAVDASAMLADLAAGHEAVAGAVRRLSAAATDAGDLVTADLAVARLASHDQATWMLRATLNGSAAMGRRGPRPGAPRRGP